MIFRHPLVLVIVAVVGLSFITVVQGQSSCLPDSTGTVPFLECLSTISPEDARYLPFAFSQPLPRCTGTRVNIVTSCDDATLLRVLPPSGSPQCTVVVVKANNLTTSFSDSDCARHPNRYFYPIDLLIFVVASKIEILEGMYAALDTDYNANDWESDLFQDYHTLAKPYAMTGIVVVGDTVLGKGFLDGSIRSLNINPHPACASTRGKYCTSQGIVTVAPAMDLYPNNTVALVPEPGITFPNTVQDIYLGEISEEIFDRLPLTSTIRTFGVMRRQSGRASLRESFSAWTSLEMLVISDSYMGGRLFPAYKTWTRMYHLVASNTLLRGTLPNELSSWTRMRRIVMWRSQSSGTLPDWGTWTNIKTFDLSAQHLEGTIPESYSAMTNMWYFDISVNGGINGTIPKSLSSWGSSMVFFYVGNNPLTGAIPGELKTWTSLQEVDMSFSKFTGPWPDELSGWTSMTSFDVHNNPMMTGTIPSAYQTWTQLNTFMVHGTSLSGEIPSSLTAWTNLAKFMVSDTQLSGSVPFSHELSQIDASRSNVSFPLNLRARTIICVSCTSVMSELPSGSVIDFQNTTWSALPKVTSKAISVTLDGSRFVTADLSGWASSIPKLNKLSLNRCGLSGTLPGILLQKFSNLALTGNLLSGTLPNVGGVSPLLILNAGYNDLEGPLPAEWGTTMVNMSQLTLTSNRITTGMPSTWSYMKSLRVVRIARNALQSIDGSFLWPPGLETFDASYNRNLSFAFPVALEKHSKIRQVNFRSTGMYTLPQSLPSTLTMFDASDTLWQDVPDWVAQPLPAGMEYVNIMPRSSFIDVNVVLPEGLNLQPGVSLSKYSLVNAVNAQSRKNAWFGRTVKNAPPSMLVSELPQYGITPDDLCLTVDCPSIDIMGMVVSKLMNTVTYDNSLLDCQQVCRQVALTFAFPPRAPVVGKFAPPTISFTIADSPASRVCQCDPFEDFLDATVDQFYKATIIPVPQGCNWCGQVNSFRVLSDGMLTLPESSMELLFGVEYVMHFDWLGSGHSALVSPPFHLQQCLDVKQSALFNTSLCQQCPSDGQCDGTTTVRTTKNVWRPSVLYNMFVRCDDSALACGGSTADGTSCSKGYEGPLCSICSDGYGKSGSFCLECPPTYAGIVVTLLVISALTFIMVASVSMVTCQVVDGLPTRDTVMERLKIKFAALMKDVSRLVKILLAWVFVAGVLARSKCAQTLPPFPRNVLSIHQQIATISPLTTSAFSCLVNEQRVYVNLILYTIGAIPLCLLVSLAVYLVNVVGKVGRLRRWPVSIATCSITCIALLVYPQLTITIADLTDCQEIEFTGEGVKTISYNTLKSEPMISCDDPEYLRYRNGAVAAAVIAIIGFPVLCAFLHYRVSEDSVRYLSNALKPEAWWWELTVMVRKVIVVICVTWVEKAFTQIALYIVVCAVSVALGLWFRPYEIGMYNSLELLSTTTCVVLGCLVLIAHEYQENPAVPYLLGIIAIIISLGVFCISFSYYVYYHMKQQSPQSDDKEAEKSSDVEKKLQVDNELESVNPPPRNPLVSVDGSESGTNLQCDDA